MKYYTLDKIEKENARYNIIFGERSNGKTYSVLEKGIKDYFNKGYEIGIIRRMQDDFKSKRGSQMFAALENNNVISKYSNNEYQSITYYAGRWYLQAVVNGKLLQDEKPFAYAFALSSFEHDKSISYPKINNILFDEFITRGYYLPDEFVIFMNVLSTIIRDRDNVKIYMLGNTVNKYCPYFDEMGLKHIRDMKQGDIDIYTYGKSDLKVAVEYTKPNASGKKSDVYFAFDNPKLQMITGGEWEIDLYPHLPNKYLPKEVEYIYFIKFGDDMLQCNIISQKDGTFTYIHKKTTDLKDENKDILFTNNIVSHRPNIRTHISKPYDKIGEKIFSFYKNNKVFYQSNEIGEIVRNYLLWCQKN